VKTTVARLKSEYESISVFRTQTPESLLWSLSSDVLKDQMGAVLRVAALETEAVRKWLENALRGLENLIGTDVYRQAFA